MQSLIFKSYVLFLSLPLISGIITESGQHALQPAILDPTSQTCSSGDFEVDETTESGMIESSTDTCDVPRVTHSGSEISKTLPPKDSSSGDDEKPDEVTTTNPKKTGNHFLSLHSKGARIFFMILCAIVLLPFLFGLWDRFCARRSNSEEAPNLDYSLANISVMSDGTVFGYHLIRRINRLMARFMNWLVFRDVIPRATGNRSLDTSSNSNLPRPPPDGQSLPEIPDAGTSDLPHQFEQETSFTEEREIAQE